MTYIFDKQYRKEFDLAEALTGWTNIVNGMGNPVKIIAVLDDVHHNSSVIFKWAAMDVKGKVMNWHVSTATKDGHTQLGGNLSLYDADIPLEQSQLEIW